MYISGDYVELNITKKDAESVDHSGDCEEDVKALLQKPYIQRQFKKLNPESIKKELKQYGAWDEEELEDLEQNKIRLLWILGCELSERLFLKM